MIEVDEVLGRHPSPLLSSRAPSISNKVEVSQV
jgi:hypothetical protein